MAKVAVKAGSTSNKLQIFVQDSSSTTGAGLSGLLYNSAGLTAYYIRPGNAASTPITLATATVGTYTSGGFKEIDAVHMKGVYEFDPPDACFTSGAPSCFIYLQGATSMAPLVLEIQLDVNTASDVYSRTGVIIALGA